MDALATLVCLAVRVALFVPSTVAVDGIADAETVKKWERIVGRSFAEWFGGFTQTTAIGGWNGQNGLTTEAVTIIYANANSASLESHVSDVIGLAEVMKKALGQESVALEVDGKLYLV